MKPPSLDSLNKTIQSKQVQNKTAENHFALGKSQPPAPPEAPLFQPQKPNHRNRLTLAWIGSASGPLQWCLQQLSTIAAMQCWNQLADWLSTPQTTRASYDRIVLALDWRNPELTETVNQLNNLDPTQPVACLLPENWLGHRRSHTPPLNIATFYWWQIQDGLIPWLLAGEKNGLPSSALWPLAARTERWIDFSILQNALTPPRLSLFISQTRVNLDAYCEFLQSLGGETLVHQSPYFEIPNALKSIRNSKPQNSATAQPNSTLANLQSTDPLMVWWAKHEINKLAPACFEKGQHQPTYQPNSSHEDSDYLHELAYQIRILQSEFPNCKLGWITSMPNWNHWQTLQQIGFSKILTPPFHLNGLLQSTADNSMRTTP